MRTANKQRDAAVIERYTGGEPMTMADVAAEFGLTASGVLYLLRRNGVPNRRPSHNKVNGQGRPGVRLVERDAALVALYTGDPNGVTLDQVGDRFGVTRERVRQILKRNDVQPTRRWAKHTKRLERQERRQAKLARDARVRALYDSGLTMAEVGERIGYCWSNIKRILDKTNHPRHPRCGRVPYAIASKQISRK